MIINDDISLSIIVVDPIHHNAPSAKGIGLGLLSSAPRGKDPEHIPVRGSAGRERHVLQRERREAGSAPAAIAHEVLARHRQHTDELVKCAVEQCALQPLHVESVR